MFNVSHLPFSKYVGAGFQSPVNRDNYKTYIRVLYAGLALQIALNSPINKSLKVRITLAKLLDWIRFSCHMTTVYLLFFIFVIIWDSPNCFDIPLYVKIDSMYKYKFVRYDYDIFVWNKWKLF